jgi:hypothetical protein
MGGKGFSRSWATCVAGVSTVRGNVQRFTRHLVLAP